MTSMWTCQKHLSVPDASETQQTTHLTVDVCLSQPAMMVTHHNKNTSSSSSLIIIISHLHLIYLLYIYTASQMYCSFDSPCMYLLYTASQMYCCFDSPCMYLLYTQTDINMYSQQVKPLLTSEIVGFRDMVNLIQLTFDTSPLSQLFHHYHHHHLHHLHHYYLVIT